MKEISPELENLVRAGSLKSEVPSADEIEALRRSGAARLRDAANASLASDSRFDLAYNAAHALALAALRFAGYRSNNRYVVFQCLAHTLGMPPGTVRILSKCHGIRNQAEYEGAPDIDDRLVTDLIAAARAVQRALDGVIA